MSGSNVEKENVGAAFRVTFGTSLWVAILVHVLAVEIYVCDSLKRITTQLKHVQRLTGRTAASYACRE